MGSVTAGVILALGAGILNGSFAAPTKYTRLWKWENLWAVWAVAALLVFPWLMALYRIPGLMSMYRGAGWGPVIMLAALGLGFGLAQVFFGLGIAAIGIALNFAIAIGISTALGAFVPLVVLHPKAVGTPKGMLILGGVFLVLVGIAFCAAAGRAKERELTARDAASSTSGSFDSKAFRRGLLLAVLAGLLSPLENFGLAFGTPLLQGSAAHGVSIADQAGVIWPPMLTATAVAYLIYCAYLWRKNASFTLYAAPRTGLYWFYGALMGALWMGSVYIYGAASSNMGTMGPILGWPLFMSAIIITSNAWGLATGEWKGISRKPIFIMLLGILVLIVGFCTLAYSSGLE